jgi:hypothetical protein
LDDIQKRVEKPSFDELESYYLRNISKFQQSEPIDPNNPEAGTRTITRPFAQVMQQVRQEVEKQRTEALANNILNEARQMIDAGWDTLDLEKAAVAQMQQAAGDYTAAAKELEKKYQISVVTGKTGWLRPEDLSSEPFLRRVVLTAPSSVRLIDVLLAIPEDGKPSSQPGLPPVRVWETISPISGGMPADGQYITLRGMVRVIGIQPPLVPEDVNFSFDNHGVSLSQPPQPSVFSVREQVIKDLKTLRAMEKARTQAADLVRFVEADGWEKGLQRFYETYYPQTDPNSPSPLRPQLRTLPEQTVPPQSQVEMLRQRLAVPSASRDILVSRYQNAVFIRKLAEMLDPSQETTGPIARLLVFEPARNVVVVKQLTRKPATEKDYADNKSKVAMQRAMLAKIDLGLVHFNPKNIAGRMGLVYKKTKEPPQLMPVDVDLPMD